MRYICETLCNFATEKEQTHDATQKIRCPQGTRHISTETWGSLWKLCVSVFLCRLTCLSNAVTKVYIIYII